MAGSSVGVGGVYKALTNGTAVGVGGVWKSIAKIFVGVSGTWKEAWVAATYSLPDAVYDSGTYGINTIQATVRMNTNGTWEEVPANLGGGDSGNWVTPTSLAPGSYTVSATYSGTGTISGSSTAGDDLALSTQRTWTLNPPSAGSFAGTLTLTLKDGGGNTVATSNVSLSVDAL